MLVEQPLTEDFQACGFGGLRQPLLFGSFYTAPCDGHGVIRYRETHTSGNLQTRVSADWLAKLGIHCVLRFPVQQHRIIGANTGSEVTKE
ncbi:hypothetical protein DQ392_28950 [Streptomyces reniochalinae]|uniref:Uncharacterized protein n=1 Tax=Streptomyces reniochalinae TaxID=2250578 RepID=A0A367EBM4_9ACTN|nr:hypothetical protein DQ392_28950 [Streptomyces reniochalinae]